MLHAPGSVPQKVDRRPEGSAGGSSKRERCFGVEAFWRQLGPAERRNLLRAPVAKMAEGAPWWLARWPSVCSLLMEAQPLEGREGPLGTRWLLWHHGEARSAELPRPLPRRCLADSPPPDARRPACAGVPAAVRAEQGEEGVRELAEALALLRQQGGRCAAYWRCPCCDTRLLDAAAFVQHVQLYHEEVQYTPGGAAVQCTKCLKEVRQRRGRQCGAVSGARPGNDLAAVLRPGCLPSVCGAGLRSTRLLRVQLPSAAAPFRGAHAVRDARGMSVTPYPTPSDRLAAPQVVGAHYQNEEPGFPTVVLCMTCCWDEQILQAAGGLVAGMRVWHAGAWGASGQQSADRLASHAGRQRESCGVGESMVRIWRVGGSHKWRPLSATLASPVCRGRRQRQCYAATHAGAGAAAAAAWCTCGGQWPVVVAGSAGGPPRRGARRQQQQQQQQRRQH